MPGDKLYHARARPVRGRPVFARRSAMLIPERDPFASFRSPAEAQGSLSAMFLPLKFDPQSVMR